MEESTLLDIAKTRRVIQDKLQTLRRQKEDAEKYYKFKYKPLTDYLEKIHSKEVPPQVPVKRPYYIIDQRRIPALSTPAVRSRLKTPKPAGPSSRIPRWAGAQSTIRPILSDVDSSPSESIDVCSSIESGLSDSKTSEIPSSNDETQPPSSSDEPPTPVIQGMNQSAFSYLTKLVKNDLTELDDVYGVKYNGEGFILGDTLIEFKNNSVEIEDEKFICTPGLTELLFSKAPKMDKVNADDRMKYKLILKMTKAHKLNSSQTGNVIRNKNNPKYNQIIKELFPPVKKKGDGTSNPNQLVNRLRQLMPLKHKHRKEIEQIEALLRDGGYIE